MNKEEQNKNKILNNIDFTKVATDKPKGKDKFLLKKKRKLFNVSKAESNGLNEVQKKCNLFNVKKDYNNRAKLNCSKLEARSEEEGNRSSAFKRIDVFTFGSFENKEKIGSMFSNKSSSVFSEYSFFPFRNIFNENSGSFNFLLCNMLKDEPKSSGNLFG